MLSYQCQLLCDVCAYTYILWYIWRIHSLTINPNMYNVLGSMLLELAIGPLQLQLYTKAALRLLSLVLVQLHCHWPLPLHLPHC